MAADLPLYIKLLAKDLASKTIKGVSKEVGTLGRISGHAQRGVRNLGTNLTRLGAVAAVGIGAAVKSGIESLATLESAVASVDGAIAQMGLTVSGSQVAAWANEIETAVGAAFDDKDIVAATENLIRYGKITDENLRPAMEIMTDLAAKTGDVAGASNLLGKALADPAKAAGKLSRYGIILTKQQQEQIKVMTEAGDVAGAQALLLEELARTTKGAAAASQGPYRRAMSVLADVTEDAQRALAEGFLPVLMKLSDMLSTALGDESVKRNIREFGAGLASGLDSLIGIAKNLPWDQIGASLKLAGDGAKAVLGAFNSLPSWVQTAVLTGWGLNKLTGGALGSIVGELGKGIIHGVLGMQAGVVNLRAGTVTGIGGGGTGGAVGGAAGGGRLAAVGSAVAKVAVVGMAAGVAVMLGQELAAQSERLSKQGTAVLGQGRQFKDTASNEELVAAIDNIEGQFRDPLNALALAITNPLNGAGDKLVKLRDELKAELYANRQRLHEAIMGTTGSVDQLNAATGFDLRAVKTAVDSGLSKTVTAANATAAVIRNKDMSPKVNVSTSVSTVVSVRAVTNGQTTVAAYNNRGSSATWGGGR